MFRAAMYSDREFQSTATGYGCAVREEPTPLVSFVLVIYYFHLIALISC